MLARVGTAVAFPTETIQSLGFLSRKEAVILARQIRKSALKALSTTGSAGARLIDKQPPLQDLLKPYESTVQGFLITGWTRLGDRGPAVGRIGTMQICSPEFSGQDINSQVETSAGAVPSTEERNSTRQSTLQSCVASQDYGPLRVPADRDNSYRGPSTTGSLEPLESSAPEPQVLP